MAKQEFPNVDGWTVHHDPGICRFYLVKPHPSGKPAKVLQGDPALTVQVFYGEDADPAIAYAAAVRDAYAEDVRVGTFPEAAERFAAADRAVIVAKVQRGLAAGTHTRETAIERLAQAGVTGAEIDAATKGA